jgi:hypothetical protein
VIERLQLLVWRRTGIRAGGRRRHA